MTGGKDRESALRSRRSCPELGHTSSMASALACLVNKGPAATGAENVAAKNGT
jgi:hypothetical protein